MYYIVCFSFHVVCENILEAIIDIWLKLLLYSKWWLKSWYLCMYQHVYIVHGLIIALYVSDSNCSNSYWTYTLNINGIRDNNLIAMALQKSISSFDYPIHWIAWGNKYVICEEESSEKQINKEPLERKMPVDTKFNTNHHHGSTIHYLVIQLVKLYQKHFYDIVNIVGNFFF